MRDKAHHTANRLRTQRRIRRLFYDAWTLNYLQNKLERMKRENGRLFE